MYVESICVSVTIDISRNSNYANQVLLGESLILFSNIKRKSPCGKGHVRDRNQFPLFQSIISDFRTWIAHLGATVS